MIKYIQYHLIIKNEPALKITFHLNLKIYISDIISSLGKEYNAPIFHPHCTLISPVTDLETAQTLIDQLNFEPFDVQMRGFGQTDIIWKTVFIKLEANPYLTLLNYLFSQAFDTDYNFLPHFHQKFYYEI